MDMVAGPLPPTRLGVDVTRVTLQCMADATSCDALGRCLDFEFIAADDPRCAIDAGVPEGGTCIDDGGAVLLCSSGQVLHCQNPYFGTNAQCLLGSDGNSYCAIDKNCGGLAGGAACEGPLQDFCNDGKLHATVDCGVGGYRCGVDVDAGVACLTGNVYRPCGPNTSVSCVGDVLTVCDSANISEFDCAALGGTCKNDGAPRCARLSDSCSPFDGNVNVCIGDTVQLCIGGKSVSYNCRSIGQTCAAGACAPG
jgi:hypothetical protein